MPFGVLSVVRDLISHAKIFVNRLRGFSAATPPKVPFPTLFRITLTTVLHYRADCDCTRSSQSWKSSTHDRTSVSDSYHRYSNKTSDYWHFAHAF